jgi:hypothetical protein
MKKATRTRKRAATESDSESQSDSEPTTRKKARLTKKKVSEEDVEIIDVDSTPQPEDISDNEQGLPNGPAIENEVSYKI